MKAIILAAGQGARMGEVTKDIPKPLIKLNNKPILIHQIESLNSNGIKDISIVIGFKKDKVKEACKNHKIKFYEFDQFKEKGLIEGLYSAKEELDEDVLLIYGDVYFEREVISDLLKEDHDFSIGVDTANKDDPSDKEEVENYYGVEMKKGSTKVAIDNGFVKDISKKIEKNKISGTYVGITKMKKVIAIKVRNKIKELIDKGDIKKYPGPSYLWKDLLSNGQKIHPVFINPNSYIEIDYPEDLERAKEMFENRIKAVLFDADQVIYIRDDETLRPLIQLLSAKGFNVSGEEITKANDKYKLDSFKGKLTKDDNLRKTLDLLNVPYDEKFFQQFKEVFIPTYSQIKVKGSVVPLFKKLKDAGIKIAIITDSFATEKHKWDMFKKIEVSDYIDCIISSNDTGYTKDQKEPYLIAIDKLNVGPNQAIFVGHQQYEMDGAKKAGVKSVSLGEKIKSDFFVERIEDIANILKI